jgi:hypothetical protein
MTEGSPKPCIVVGCVCWAFFLALGSGPSLDQHPTSEGTIPPGLTSVKVEFENDAVLVVRIHMNPHEKTPMHDLTPRVVVWLTNARLRDTSADGRTNDINRAAGAVDWVPAQRHAGENLGDEPIEFLGIVPKAGPSVHPR